MPVSLQAARADRIVAVISYRPVRRGLRDPPDDERRRCGREGFRKTSIVDGYENVSLAVGLPQHLDFDLIDLRATLDRVRLDVAHSFDEAFEVEFGPSLDFRLQNNSPLLAPTH